ncbi:hypothetical protein, partial [Klebsiella pneumoniae]|uniref:hypothetical protein n=1 Tax=Klebsiella pneumoniae TaxID=573 RepID=UPI00200E2C3E
MRHDFYDCVKGLDVHLSQCVMPLPLLLPCFFIFKIASAPLRVEFFNPALLEVREGEGAPTTDLSVFEVVN